VPNTVARISDVPDRAGTITIAEFRHSLDLVATAEGRHAAPRPGGRGYQRLMRTAIRNLLELIWIKGQAAEMNIVVTRRQVSRLLASIKKQNFKSAAEYHEFLRESHYTPRDVYERVELQLLVVRVQKRIAAGVTSKSEEQKVFKEFVAEFNERWRGRTVCAPRYAIDACSNGPQ
jgi:hypothetical protein